jgi:hypothetical protein
MKKSASTLVYSCKPGNTEIKRGEPSSYTKLLSDIIRVKGKPRIVPINGGHRYIPSEEYITYAAKFKRKM